MHVVPITFGQYLHEILVKKNISISALSKMLNITSRNIVYRLINNQSSYSKIMEIKDSIAEVLKMDTSEKYDMERAIEFTCINKENYVNRKSIIELLRDTRKRNYEVPKLAVSNFDLVEGEEQYINEIFKSYSKLETMDILVINSSYTDLIKLISFLVYNNPKVTIKIQHIIQMSSNNSKNIELLSAIFGLVNYFNYDVYCNQDLKIPFENQTSIFTDLVIIKKVDEKGKLTTDIFNVLGNMDSISYLSNVGSNLYEFHLKQFNYLKTFCSPLLEDFFKNKFIDSIVEAFTYYLKLENNTPYYCIKPTPPIKMIDIKIINSLLKESSYYEVPNDYSKLENILEISNQRHQLFWTNDSFIKTIFTKEGLISFVKDKKLSDHPKGLRPFTSVEIKATLLNILQKNEKQKNFNFYILKEDLIGKQFNMAYYKNVALNIDNITPEYEKYNKKVIIYSKHILKLFDDFFENEIIQNHTLSKEEAVKFMEELIASIG